MKKIDKPTGINLLENSFLQGSGFLIYELLAIWFLRLVGKTFYSYEQTMIMAFCYLAVGLFGLLVAGLLIMVKGLRMYMIGFKQSGIVLMFMTMGWMLIFSMIVIYGLYSGF